MPIIKKIAPKKATTKILVKKIPKTPKDVAVVSVSKEKLVAKTSVKKPKSKKSVATAFAVIETGGKQYKVSEDQVISIEKLDAIRVGDVITFDKVVLLETGSETTLGTPYISDAKVTGVLEKSGLGEKIRVQRFHSKSNWHRAYGHRQPFMKVKITKIS